MENGAMYPLVVALLLGAVPSSDQTLGELARNEKDRRAKVGKAGEPAVVISEKDLEEARGGALSVSGTRVSDRSSDSAEEPLPESARNGLTAKQAAELRSEWARIWEEQMRQAAQDLERATEDRYQCRSAERYFFVPIAVDCDGVDLRVANAEARLRKVKRSRYNWELLIPPKP
jgi:hypothetical protein